MFKAFQRIFMKHFLVQAINYSKIYDILLQVKYMLIYYKKEDN